MRAVIIAKVMVILPYSTCENLPSKDGFSSLLNLQHSRYVRAHRWVTASWLR